MTDTPKTVSDTIANEPADVAVPPPMIPADCGTKPIGEPKVAVDSLPSEQKPAATHDLLIV